jgi:hypothetical protein
VGERGSKRLLCVARANHPSSCLSAPSPQELWWYGSSKLFLINVYAGPPMMPLPVSGTVESSSLAALKPPRVRALQWSEFTEAASRRPPLQRHTALFGMRVVSPLAHVGGERDRVFLQILREETPFPGVPFSFLRRGRRRERPARHVVR